jgi:hypothetical protein
MFYEGPDTNPSVLPTFEVYFPFECPWVGRQQCHGNDIGGSVDPTTINR